MKLKHRLPLAFSLLFSLLLAAVMFSVYYLFANFRKGEFKDRLVERAETTARLLLNVKEVDERLLKIIDRNSFNRLYKEKTRIYNDSLTLVYSSSDDNEPPWSPEEINSIKIHKEVFKRYNGHDVLGLYYQYGGRDYYVFISAEDKYRNRRLNYLKLLLVGAFLVGTLGIWWLSFYLSKRTLLPLDRLRQQMQEITSKNLNTRVLEPLKEDEIKALSRSFNEMLDRIDQAYKGQKDFTSNASHELRTPITRIVMQLENLLSEDQPNNKTREALASISEDAYQLSDVVTSLLLLSRIEESRSAPPFERLRLDEIIFSAASQLSRMHQDFILQFGIEAVPPSEAKMEVVGDDTLLKIVFLNLLKNAYTYSDNQKVQCLLHQEHDFIRLYITNTGDVPTAPDTASLFNTFTRGDNVKNAQGSGVGLSLVQRILQYHHATIVYKIPAAKTNQIIVTFSVPPTPSS